MSDKPAKARRMMPKNEDVWVSLEPPTEDYLEVLAKQGVPVLDFSGFKILCIGKRRTGAWSEHIQAMAKRDEIADRLSALSEAESDEARDALPQVSDEERVFWREHLTDSAKMLREEVLDWDFLDDEGNPLPYSPDAWRELDEQLVRAANDALQNRYQPGKPS